ncbi:MAG: FecR domain-containing protein [Bacteroidota bacterium]
MKGYNNWMNMQDGDINESDLKQLWNATASYKEGYSPNVEKGHEMFMDRIRSDQHTSARIVRLKKKSPFLRMAAAIAVLIVAGILFKNFTETPTSNGLEIVEAADEVKEMNLEDGTSVTLNTLSSLTYPDHFDESSRNVQLKGEAFFDVIRDESKPFKIETDKATVEVLGTSFNVRSFEDEDFLEVYVKNGSVAVHITGEEEVHVLTQGELLKVDFTENQVEKTVEESDNTIAWNTGKLTFINRPMLEIFEALEKLHKIKFDLKEEDFKSCRYTVNFGSTDMKDVIKGLEVACGITFSEVNENTYEVQGSCCD